MIITIQIRRDTLANWTSRNPVLYQGEIGYCTDLDKLKIGDGVKTWNQLDYVQGIGLSGYSGISGYSGFSGLSGYSGDNPGSSGYSGISGYSGLGVSGYSGLSGKSGYSGLAGSSGISGYSGLGVSGLSGYSGLSGKSGYSGLAGTSGISGYSGLGVSGLSGTSGLSGKSGYSGLAGTSGTSGYSGLQGISGYSGAGGGVSDGDKGDITVSGSGATWTIDSPISAKRWVRRIGTTTSSQTPTINTDLYDEYRITAQTNTITSFTTNLTGTPNDGDILVISITSSVAGVTRSITWGTSFVAGTTPLPTEIGATTLVVLFKIIANVSATVWQCISVTNISA